MVATICEVCEEVFHWNWEDAFIPDAFNSCHNQCETWQVKIALAHAGYGMDIEQFTTRPYISTIYDRDWLARGGIDRPFLVTGNPRTCLPQAVLEILDKAFPFSGPPRYGREEGPSFKPNWGD